VTDTLDLFFLFHGDYWTIIYPLAHQLKLSANDAKLLGQALFICSPKFAAGMDVEVQGQLLLQFLSHTAKVTHRYFLKDLPYPVRLDNSKSVRFHHVGCQLGQQFIRGYANGTGNAKGVLDPGFELIDDGFGRSKQRK